MRRLRLCLAVAIGLVFVAGCGGNGSSATVTTSTIAAAPGGSTTTPSFSGSKSSKYCDLARQFDTAVSSPITNDPKALFDQFDSFASQYLEVVPGAIKADAETVVGALRQLEASFKAVNYDIAKVDPSALSSLTDPKFTAATDRIDAYDSQVCGITPASSP